MRRLNESRKDLDEGERLLSELVEALPRTRSDPLRKRRLRAQLESSLRVQSGGRYLGRRAVVVLGALCIATAAAAMVGGSRLTSRTPQHLPSAERSSEESHAPLHREHQLHSDASTPDASPYNAASDPPLNEKSAAEVKTAAPSHEHSASTPTATVRASSRSGVPVASHAAAPVGEDPSLVAAAIQALRNENNPVRARSLLSQYMKSNPRGAFAEEALALSIEAAVKMHDPRAQSLARTYLDAYPRGRHRTLAENVLAR